MRISVAICTHNGERYLREQLESIAAQDRHPDEVVISDDGSVDATHAILDEFATASPFSVRVFHSERHLGVARNYERAIGLCDGDVIVLGDQDDRWSTERLSRLEAVFNRPYPPALAFSDAWLIDAGGRRTGERLWSVVGFADHHRDRMRRDPFGQLMGRSIVSGCTLAFDAKWRPLLLSFPSEDTGTAVRILHDRWISLCLAAATGPGGVEVISEPLVEYRQHPRQQVGIPALQIRRLVPSGVLRWRSAAVPTREHSSRLGATADVLEIIEKRLDLHMSEGVGPARARVADAIDHLRARAGLGTNRVSRVRGVINEWRNGRYHDYSLGLASAAADLLRPNR
ncbi:MAG: hypothetical protein QOI95_2496 [Acidimicrobiaceae bacterium]